MYKDLKNGQATYMNDEKIARLEAIGFQWDLSRDAWDKSFAELQTFKAVNGHCNVGVTYKVSVETPVANVVCLFSHFAVNKSPGKSKAGNMGEHATIHVQGTQKWPSDGHE
jgi:hypothetical protein